MKCLDNSAICSSSPYSSSQDYFGVDAKCFSKGCLFGSCSICLLAIFIRIINFLEETKRKK